MYGIGMTKALKYNISNDARECISSISYKIYLNAMQYQCYQAIDINDARFCSYKLQDSKSYFLNNCSSLAQKV